MIDEEHGNLWENCDDFIPSPDDLEESLMEIESDLRMGKISKEKAHIKMDQAILFTLERLGYGLAVDIFRETPKWYS